MRSLSTRGLGSLKGPLQTAMDPGDAPAMPLVQAIAPRQVLRGVGAWQQAQPLLAKLSRRPLLLGRGAATARLRQSLLLDLLD